MNRALCLLAGAFVVAAPFCVPGLPAWADPADVADAEAGTAPGSVGMATSQVFSSSPAEGGNSVGEACRQFGAALDLAASNYEDFAYATAGSGDVVDYQDPVVSSSNVLGRTALREAARTALSASRMQGLTPDVSDPMQAWSLHATKLLLIMLLHAGGDSLNSSANQLNADAHAAQMACAADGGTA
jgi:hypothetical protein